VQSDRAFGRTQTRCTRIVEAFQHLGCREFGQDTADGLIYSPVGNIGDTRLLKE
jgi:hypothetical protein